ncbi:jg23715 [Pararge aegeria aegeria]|uniref:Jg23715 protein n=1 Tax=Pararge aegeria aegeria TaxID=348720 RepID=A0A8S4S5M4_9NEOP|nr:jg23715 [Pararge aegeria aegeria]
MLHILLISLTTIFFAKQAKSTNNWNVELILEKLLASDHFDKIADIIAEKAAEKINSHSSRKTEKKNQDLNADRRKHINEFQSNVNIDVINDAISTKTPVINKLSLKYKLFTKRAIEELDSNNNKNVKSIDSRSDDEALNNIDINNLNDTNNFPSNDIELNQEVDDYDEVYEINAKAKKAEENSIEKTQETLKHNKDIKSEIIEIINNSESTEVVNNNQKNVSPKVADKEKKYSNLKLESELKKSNMMNNVQAKHIYKEGGRLFALQSSSDYDEYHKELNRTMIEDTSEE